MFGGLRLCDPEPYGHTVAAIPGQVFTCSQPATSGELVFMLWLVTKGARPAALDATTLSSSAF